MAEETFRYTTYRTLDGFELRITPPDDVERRVQKYFVVTNPDQDLCIVQYLQGTPTPWKQRMVRRGEAEAIRKAERVHVVPFSADVVAMLVDKPYGGTRILLQPMVDTLNQVLAGARLEAQPVTIQEAEQLLNEWNYLMIEGRI